VEQNPKIASILYLIIMFTFFIVLKWLCYLCVLFLLPTKQYIVYFIVLEGFSVLFTYVFIYFKQHWLDIKNTKWELLMLVMEKILSSYWLITILYCSPSEYFWCFSQWRSCPPFRFEDKCVLILTLVGLSCLKLIQLVCLYRKSFREK
jgi:hypothetical protein